MEKLLAGTNAVAKNREIMGSTNPAEVAKGSIRSEFFPRLGK